MTVVRRKALDAFDAADVGEGGRVSAPMHGKVIEVLVAAGDQVRKESSASPWIEAMKMEHALLAPLDGTVASAAVSRRAGRRARAADDDRRSGQVLSPSHAISPRSS